LKDDALDEGNLRSRFGQFGTVTFVHVLPDSFTSAAVVYDCPEAYENAIEASKTSGIRLCREFVQVHPIYSTDPQHPYEFDKNLRGMVAKENGSKKCGLLLWVQGL